MIERVVDTREYVSVLREIAEEGRVVSLRGDMVFYQRDSGQYVMHRIWKKKEDGYYIVGDAQTQIEGPVRRDQIFARITKVKRKGRILQPGDFWWEFFEHIWIRIVPLRRPAVGIYSAFCRLVHREKTTENH